MVYVSPTEIRYRDPIVTPRYKKGVDWKIRTQTITLPNKQGYIILNKQYE